MENLVIAGIMETAWFKQLSTFVAVNTVLYLTLAIIKILPKAYLSDWVDHRDRRSEDRSIYAGTEPPPRESQESGATENR